MAVLPVLHIPHPILKTKALPVEVIDDELRAFLDDMVDTMFDEDGVGLAANQVGVLKRVLVYDASREENVRDPKKVINPEILWRSDEQEELEQGCLSVPNHYAAVKRPKAIRVKYQDETGQSYTQEFSGFLSHVLQHEIDHLNGILFIEHLTPLKRAMVAKKAKKLEREQEEGE